MQLRDRAMVRVMVRISASVTLYSVACNYGKFTYIDLVDTVLVVSPAYLAILVRLWSCDT